MNHIETLKRKLAAKERWLADIKRDGPIIQEHFDAANAGYAVNAAYAASCAARAADAADAEVWNRCADKAIELIEGTNQ